LFKALGRYNVLAFRGGIGQLHLALHARSIERRQKALLNLVQIQIAFMTYFDRLSWWENFAQMAEVRRRPIPLRSSAPALRTLESSNNCGACRESEASDARQERQGVAQARLTSSGQTREPGERMTVRPATRPTD